MADYFLDETGKSQASMSFCKREQINTWSTPRANLWKADQIFHFPWAHPGAGVCPARQSCLPPQAAWTTTHGHQCGAGAGAEQGWQKLKLNTTRLSWQVVLEQVGAVDSLNCLPCDEEKNTDNDGYSISQGISEIKSQLIDKHTLGTLSRCSISTAKSEDKVSSHRASDHQ